MAQLIPTLLAAVVHDNKNLMHEVLLRIDAIAADERAEPIKSDIEQLRQKLKHLVDGSLSVLSLYQRNMDKESLQLNYNTVTLADFLQEILDESTDSVAQKGLEMEVLLDDELPSVWTLMQIWCDWRLRWAFKMRSILHNTVLRSFATLKIAVYASV